MKARRSNRRVIGTALGLVAAVVAIAWFLRDDDGAVVATPNVALTAPAGQRDHALTPADDARRDVIEPPSEADAANSPPLAYVGRVEDLEGQPLADVVVKLLQRDAAAPEVSMRTLADGSFMLPVPTPTRGALEFVAPAHVDTIRGGFVPNEPVVVRLEPGIAIKGRVVEAMTHEPVAGALVRRDSGNGGWIAETAADATGAFTCVVPHLPAVLGAHSKNRGSGTVVVTSADAAVDIELARRRAPEVAWYRVLDRVTREPVDDVTIQPGPATRIERGLFRAGIAFDMNQERSAIVAAPAHFWQWFTASRAGGADESHPLEVLLEPATSIAGRVVDHEGIGVAGATVVVERDSAGIIPLVGSVGRSSFDEARATTDAAGTFVVAAVALSMPMLLRVERGGAMLHDSVPVVVKTRDGLRLGDIQVDASIPLDVRVLSAAGATPCANATVFVYEKGAPRALRAGADGIVHVDQASHVTFVAATAKGCAPAAIRLGDDARNARSLELRLGPSGRLAGRVENAEHQPLRGAVVAAARSTADAMFDALADLGDDPTRRETATDADGRFEFELAPGEYRLTARHSDAAPIALQPGEKPALYATDHGDVVLTMATTGTIVLHLTSAVAGIAVPHVEFHAYVDGLGQGTSASNTNGYGVLTMRAGTPFDLDVGAGGFVSQKFPGLVLKPREVRSLEVALMPESVLSGTIQFADGTFAESMPVRLIPADRPTDVIECQTDADGAFMVGRLTPGEYRLTVVVAQHGSDLDPEFATLRPSPVVIGSGEIRQQAFVIERTDPTDPPPPAVKGS